MNNRLIQIDSISNNLPNGNVTHCPLCLGLEFVSFKDNLKLLNHPERFLCPMCKLYHIESKCAAWEKIDDSSYSHRWIFIREAACDEIIKVIAAFNTISHKINR